MNGVLVDSNVILDVILNDPDWADWSEMKLNQYNSSGQLYINSIIYAEISIGFARIEELDAAITIAGFQILELPKEALFLAGKAFLQYRRNQGTKTSTLPDFFIGAQAAVLDIDLLTRDVGRYHTYFPTINLITPQS